jgi:hypothetical protein
MREYDASFCQLVECALQRLRSLQHSAGNVGSDTAGLSGCLQAAPDAVFSTAVTALPPEEVLNRNRVKCIVDRAGYALYFSRGMLPHNK